MNLRALLLAIFCGCGIGCPAPAQIERLLAPVQGQPPAAQAGAVSSARVEDGAVLTADALAAELQTQLARQFDVAGELRIVLARAWQPVRLPSADAVVEITEFPIGGIASTFYVRVKITSNGFAILDAQVPLRAQLWEEVWIASTRLERGQALDRSLLAMQKVDVLRERQTLVPANVDPATLELAMGVPAGRPLTRRDIVERPLIRKGQVVEVVAQQGLLAVSMKALALQNGAAGELIRLRNLDSRKEFNGQILNENRVQVHF